MRMRPKSRNYHTVFNSIRSYFTRFGIAFAYSLGYMTRMIQIKTHKAVFMGALAALMLAFPASSRTGDPNPVDFGPKEALQIVSENGAHDFMVEIADSPDEQRHGYMFKQFLSDTDGMLFEFPKTEVQSIWMKDTPISLDVIFVRRNGKILKIVHSRRPFTKRSVTSGAPVPAVLELRGGLAKELGIEPGDTIVHEFFGNVGAQTAEKSQN